VLLNKEILLFLPSIIVCLLGACFLLVGAYLIYLGITLEDKFIPFMIGGYFFMFGIKLFLMHSIVSFHKGIGDFRKKMEPSTTLVQTSLIKLLGKKKITAKLKDIKAIQLLREEVQEPDGRFFSYEINLVMKRGRRINVVDHGNEKTATRQAKRLAKFLDVPLLTAKHNKPD